MNGKWLNGILKRIKDWWIEQKIILEVNKLVEAFQNDQITETELREGLQCEVISPLSRVIEDKLMERARA